MIRIILGGLLLTFGLLICFVAVLDLTVGISDPPNPVGAALSMVCMLIAVVLPGASLIYFGRRARMRRAQYVHGPAYPDSQQARRAAPHRVPEAVLLPAHQALETALPLSSGKTSESVVLFKPFGAYQKYVWLTFFRISYYYALCITNRRILFLKLGRPWWPLGFCGAGILGAIFGLIIDRHYERMIEPKGNLLSCITPEEMLTRCPDSLVFFFQQIAQINTKYINVGVLEVTTKDGYSFGMDIFFKDLTSQGLAVVLPTLTAEGITVKN